MKKLLCSLVLASGSMIFLNACSKADAQDVTPPQGVRSADDEDTSEKMLGSYVIVSSTSTSGLASLVNTKLASSSSYKLAGGPFTYFVGGTQRIGQALYK